MLKAAHKHIKATRAVKAALVLFVALVAASCSPRMKNLFFDLPPPDPEKEVVEEAAPEPAQTQFSSGTSGVFYLPEDNAERPEIEAAENWESALALLPTDQKNRPDWSAAVRDGIVRPRALEQEDLAAKAFQLDFFIPSDKPRFDAWFPHSSHTEWLGCKNCHGSVFKYTSNDMTMKEMRSGQYCGACHDKVAFSLKDCARCHTAMKK